MTTAKRILVTGGWRTTTCRLLGAAPAAFPDALVRCLRDDTSLR